VLFPNEALSDPSYYAIQYIEKPPSPVICSSPFVSNQVLKYFNMSLSFENLAHTQTRPQRDWSPRFLNAVKGLVHRASTGSIRPGSAHSNTDILHSCSCRSSQTSSTQQILWKRRGQTPGMDDYLTLSQLEDVWGSQDSYLGFIDVPQNATQYTFQDAVEAPVITKHNLIDWPAEAQPRPPPPPKGSVPRIQDHDDPNVIDGSVHPALRPEPYLSDNDSLARQQRPPPPPLAIIVPETTWI
jgi:hypothetical protein